MRVFFIQKKGAARSVLYVLWWRSLLSLFFDDGGRGAGFSDCVCKVLFLMFFIVFLIPVKKEKILISADMAIMPILNASHISKNHNLPWEKSAGIRVDWIQWGPRDDWGKSAWYCKRSSCTGSLAPTNWNRYKKGFVCDLILSPNKINTREAYDHY